MRKEAGGVKGGRITVIKGKESKKRGAYYLIYLPLEGITVSAMCFFLRKGTHPRYKENKMIKVIF